MSISLPSAALGFVLGAALSAAWFYGGVTVPAGSTHTNASGGATTTQVTVPNGSASGAISVSDQPAGNSVLIESVTVPPPGVWVAVRELNVDQSLGNILGAVRARGPRSNIEVPLLRATEPGTAYAVELYRDNGDEVFDQDADSVYVDFDSGTRVVAYFKTTQ